MNLSLDMVKTLLREIALSGESFVTPMAEKPTLIAYGGSIPRAMASLIMRQICTVIWKKTAYKDKKHGEKRFFSNEKRKFSIYIPQRVCYN
jgi:hypothetical protein